MNLRKPAMEWSDQIDLALHILHENGYTLSGIASELGCTRLEVIARAVELGIRINHRPNSKLAALVAQATKRKLAA